ncbi:MAG: SpoIID/LytB domain-containing protein [Aphanocapsa sp. GSE-SYN-MK-11-07L]|jgi:stage II sporulation protein D|nr:SpoIID/LytB domain-containing protein [Aphanocapsa sp. GSE-SYN-MK-11-07L]
MLQLVPPTAKGNAWWLSLLLWIAIATPGLATQLRVAIVEGASQVSVGSSTPAKILDGAGRPIGELKPLTGVPARPIPGGVSVVGRQASRLWIQPSNGGEVYIGDRWYRGRVQLARIGQGVLAVNHVDLEEYLVSVLGKEMYPTWPQEALKAQAVAARSFALSRRQTQIKRPGSLFDVRDTVSSQVYNGVASEFPSTQAAVAATRGQVLTYQGRLVEAVFHSTSGGYTENSENVWSSVKPYLRAVPDFDQEAPNYQWSVILTAGQLKQRLPGVGNIVALRPLRTTPQGRIMTMQVIGDRGSRTIKGGQLRSALGLKSTLFSVTPQASLVANASTKGRPALPQSFIISGRGFGHGLGMSQWGAYGMAKQGYTYSQILQHYYQGITITTLP